MNKLISKSLFAYGTGGTSSADLVSGYLRHAMPFYFCIATEVRLCRYCASMCDSFKCLTNRPSTLSASYDQYANLVLDGAVERIVVDGSYADVPFGIFVVRGENVMLLGETDAEKETELGKRLNRVTEPQIRRSLAAQKEDSEALLRGDKFEWPILDDF